MAAKWDYPNICTLSIENSVDGNGYLIVDGSTTEKSTKAVSLKGFKTPADDEDANAETSTLKSVATVIYGLFGLEEALKIGTATASAKASIVGDFE